MSLEAFFRAALLADAAVAALVGTRIYDDQIPQNNQTWPAVAVQRISTVRQYTHTMGSGQAAVGWARFQLTTVATGKDGKPVVLQVHAALVEALQTFSAMKGSGSIQQAPNFVVSERLGTLPGTTQPIAQGILDVRVWFDKEKI